MNSKHLGQFLFSSLGSNLTSFVSLDLKLQNLYCHTWPPKNPPGSAGPGLHCQGQLGTFGPSLDNNGNGQHALKRGEEEEK